VTDIQNAGWYDDTTGRNLRRYWNGTAWTDHVQRHDGTRAVDALVPTRAVTVPSPSVWSKPAKVLMGGLAVAAGASFLPWESDVAPSGQHVSATPADTGALGLILATLAATAWVAWPSIRGTLSVRRRALLTVLAAALAGLALLKVMGLNEGQAAVDDASIYGSTGQTEYGWGIGLVIYFGAMAAVWVGVIRAWISRPAPRVPAAGCSFPPPSLSR
jgi:hypothetical protein